MSDKELASKATGSAIKNSKAGFFAQLGIRRIPQFFGIFLAGSWTCLEFTQWAVSRYTLSPNWEEALVVLLLLCLPMILVLAWYHGEPGKQSWSRFEKFFIALTIIGAPAILYQLYSEHDFGSPVQMVTMMGSDGKEVEHQVARSEYIQPIVVFPFKATDSDDENHLLATISSEVLSRDLSQNRFVTTTDVFVLKDDIKRSRLAYNNLPLSLQIALTKDRAREYFVNGSFSRQGKGYQIQANLYKVSSGKKVFSTQVSSDDYFSLIDQLSEQLSQELTPNTPEFVDLPIGDLYTHNWPAFISYAKAQISANFVEPRQEAIPYYEKALELDQTFSQAAFHFALFTLQSGQINTAQTYTKLALESQQYRLTERERFALTSTNYFINKNLAESFKTLDHWTTLYPNDWMAYLMKANYSGISQRFEQMISNLEKVIELDPSQHQLWDQIGDIYSQLGQYDSALLAYSHYIEKNPNKPLAYKNLGDLYRKTSKVDRSISNYRKALAIDPNNVNVLRNLALVYARSGNLKLAEELFLQALGQSKTIRESVQVQTSLANTYWQFGQLKAAVENYQQAFKVASDNISDTRGAQSASLNAWRYYKAGYPELAQQTLDAAFELAQQKNEEIFLINVQVGQALLYNEQGFAEKAIPLYDNVFKTARGFLESGNDIQINYYLAQSYFSLGQYEKALPSFQAINEKFPDTLDFMFWPAKTLYALGQLEQAKEIYAQILKIAPGYPEYQLGFSKVLYALDDIQGAKEAVNKALSGWQTADSQFAELNEAQALSEQLSKF